MEVMVKRTLVFAAILGAFGAAARLRPVEVAPWRTEEWMESVLPKELPGYSYMPGPDGPGRSYRANQQTYDKLKPYGMVGRFFSKGDNVVDTLVVAGNDRDCFHDPYVCFPAQDFQIVSSHSATIQTRTRGSVPATVLQVKNGNLEQYAVFFYKGPDGFHPTQNTLYSDWFWNELRMGKPAEGAFYRFMGVRGQISEDELKQVAVNYLDAASGASGGVL